MEDDNSKQRWYFRVIFFFLLLHQSTGFQDCPSEVVGLADPNIIPDSSFTASTELNNEYGAAKARFNSNRCWEPNGNNKADDYLQIDLRKLFVICAVATKGNGKSVAEWTEEYNISTSLDGKTWTWYPNNDNAKVNDLLQIYLSRHKR
ncbi:Coagulation factor VIII [Exaiptasia diaphana]|nr:Coagulation factor VIII [Exaiptasia diaphana]